MVGISGGKDSVALLYLLWWQKRLQDLACELFPVHVTGLGTQEHDLPPLTDLVSSLGLELRYEEAKKGRDSGTRKLSPCFLCAWRRKHTLFSTAQKLQCNVVALGHHSDDVAVTAIMNIFYQGRFGSILPTQSYFRGTFRLIRPLYFVSEQTITKLVRQEQLPVVASSCSQVDVSVRAQAKGWLDMILTERPEAKRSLLGALHRQALDLCGDHVPDISTRGHPSRKPPLANSLIPGIGMPQ